MTQTVGAHILDRLHGHGVRLIYGYPGDGINGILGGFHEVGDVEFIQAAHEELAAFMACAHAKWTGDVGVCLATSGPGAIHLLNGLYDAKLDHQPVVAIVGQQKSISLGAKADRAWQEQLMDEVGRWWRILEGRAELDAKPLNPEKVFHELSPRLPDGCVLTADSGSGTNWWARHLRFRRGMRGALSGTLATMGPALPYAVAAKFVFPDRPVIAVEGDGAMQMNGLNALIDVAKYRERWTDPRFVVLVLNNADLNQVTWEQRVLAGDPKLEASQRLPDFPYARYAELLGFKGIRVDSADDVGPAWDEVLAAEIPVVYEAVTDPEVPPLPPHVEFEQAKQLARALARRDPASRSIIRQALKGKLQELVRR